MTRNPATAATLLACLLFVARTVHGADDWPALLEGDGTVRIPAQPSPHVPGPRTVKVYVFYPGGSIAKVTPQTGLMLSLHNWGGTGWRGTADPRQLANRYNVVAICVAWEMVANMQAAGIEVESHFIAPKNLDGSVLTNTGHGLGNRTGIVRKFGDRFLLPDSPQRLVRSGKCDFEHRDENARYPTPDGAFVISYKAGFPVGRFEPR